MLKKERTKYKPKLPLNVEAEKLGLEHFPEKSGLSRAG